MMAKNSLDKKGNKIQITLLYPGACRIYYSYLLLEARLQNKILKDNLTKAGWMNLVFLIPNPVQLLLPNITGSKLGECSYLQLTL